ncbi:hypothetical protein PIB30_081083 [Stylosanthes scabra]|uniref:Uncharacterized protein n=1 Tax=Stylosanthes scabra TaxID=79078 RepID=A0ABU6XQ10_9FABA|nr:hypothetical protein [Stylosanthes scabra]
MLVNALLLVGNDIPLFCGSSYCSLLLDRSGYCSLHHVSGLRGLYLHPILTPYYLYHGYHTQAYGRLGEAQQHPLPSSHRATANPEPWSCHSLSGLEKVSHQEASDGMHPQEPGTFSQPYTTTLNNPQMARDHRPE